MMALEKTVFTADPEQVRAVRRLVRSGRYRSASALFREAIDEKLERLRRERLAEQVDRFCDNHSADDVGDLIAAQAFDPED
jgi:Arc/MetJ-type ribon-helix-helix transcriptional regulator